MEVLNPASPAPARARNAQLPQSGAKQAGAESDFILSVNVLAVTILVSSCLAGIFVVCFAAEVRRSRRSSFERDSLLPLETGKRPSTKRP